MAPSSQNKTSRSPHRFYDYLKCLQEEFENSFTDDMSPRRFNIYLGNLKGEFELMLLEIGSLQKEIDEYRERVEVPIKKRQDVHHIIVCDSERCNKGSTSAPQIAIPSRQKNMKTGSRLLFQSRTLDKPRSSKNMAQETTIHRSSQHTTLIQKLRPPLSLVSAVTKNTETPTFTLPSPLPRSSNSTLDRPKEHGQMVEFNNEVERELDVEIAHKLFHAEPLRRVKFSRDGKYLAAGCRDGKAYIYDVQEGTLTCVLQNLLAKDDCIRAVCFSPDGKYLATGAWDGTLYIWEINRKYVRNVFKGHTSHIMSLDLSPNGRLLLSASGDNTARLWNMHDGTTKLLMENITSLDRHCYSSAVFSPDGRYIAASHSDGMVELWDVCTGQLTRTIKAHTGWTNCVFTSDGKGLMSAGWDYTLRYWDVSFLDFNRLRERSRVLKNSHRETLGITWGPDREFLVDEHFVRSLAISPDGRWVASAGKSVRIRDTRNATMQCTLSHDDSVFPSFVDFSPTGRYLAAGGNDGILKIWRYSNVASGDSLVHELGQQRS